MLVKRASNDVTSIERCYIVDFIATKISRNQFEKLQELNDWLKAYEMLEPNDVDFTWWNRCFKKLTPTRVTSAEFEIDYYGNVTEL